MTVKVLMPKGSDTMTEGKVLKWLKKEGDQISTGEAVVEIETDKVNMEVEAMGSGVLRKILVQAGKVVPVGELLAVIARPDEDISSLLGGEGSEGAPPPAVSTVPAPTDLLILGIRLITLPQGPESTIGISPSIGPSRSKERQSG